MVVEDEAAMDSMARYVLNASFEYLERQTGPTFLYELHTFGFPELYWVAVVKHFCVIKNMPGDEGQHRNYQRERSNYALRELPSSVFLTDWGLKCQKDQYMLRGKCDAWLRAGLIPEKKYEA